MRARSFRGVAVVLVALGVWSAVEGRAADSIRFQLNWKPAGSFSGYYIAEDRGYYDAEGLQVTLHHGDHTTDTIALVSDGTADIGLTTADELVKARAAGRLVKAVSAVHQRSPIVFFALDETGIARPHDFVGKTIRVTRDVASTLHTMMGFLGIDHQSYDVVSLPSDPALFLSGSVPIWGAHISGLALRLQLAGHRLNLIFPHEYGVVSYSQVIFTTDRFLETRRDAVSAFLRASLLGLQDVLEQPGLVPALIAARDASADAAMERERMLAVTPLIVTGEAPVGWIDRDVFAYIIQTLVESGEVSAPVAVEAVMDDGPIRSVHGYHG